MFSLGKDFGATNSSLGAEYLQKRLHENKKESCRNEIKSTLIR